MAKRAKTEARVLSDKIRNTRDKYIRRAKAFEQASKFVSADLATRYQAAAASLRTEAQKATMSGIREAQAQIYSLTGKQVSLTEAYMEVKERHEKRLSYIPAQRAKDLARSDTLSNVEYKYAAREIMVFTYGKIWHRDMTKQEREQAIRNKIANTLDIPLESVTAKQVMDFYRDIIREYTGDYSYDFIRDAFTDEFMSGKYAKELEQGYAIYSGGFNGGKYKWNTYEKHEQQMQESRARRKQ